jgi:hypothetical protein
MIYASALGHHNRGDYVKLQRWRSNALEVVGVGENGNTSCMSVGNQMVALKV